ncbi:RICIN domain-containing protein [Streptomyces sp. ALI-76-A]|nr:RICIN domain-containing protein [Streptomyces sp. ALI-76-A]MDL5206301.1 RICIN domain-containing protein [Streptomyces sp. ALI-76-A]
MTFPSVAAQGGGYYRLVARHSGKCLDVKDGSTTNGAHLIQWPCGAGTDQQFQRRAA